MTKKITYPDPYPRYEVPGVGQGVKTQSDSHEEKVGLIKLAYDTKGHAFRYPIGRCVMFFFANGEREGKIFSSRPQDYYVLRDMDDVTYHVTHHGITRISHGTKYGEAFHEEMYLPRDITILVTTGEFPETYNRPIQYWVYNDTSYDSQEAVIKDILLWEYDIYMDDVSKFMKEGKGTYMGHAYHERKEVTLNDVMKHAEEAVYNE